MYFLFYPLGLNVRPKEFLLPLREIEDDGNVSSYALITKTICHFSYTKHGGYKNIVRANDAI